MLMDKRWDELRLRIHAMAAAAKRVVYVPNEGNAGDALIAAGTWQFFEDCKLRTTVIKTRELRAGDTAIYAGGGNFVPEYRSCARFLRHCLKVGVQSALVLPHTIRGHDSLLHDLDDRFVLVCRDFASLDRVQASGTKAQIMMAPDMALRLDVRRLFARCDEPIVRKAFTRDMMLNLGLPAYRRWLRRLAKLGEPSGSTPFEVIRADAEASRDVVGSPDHDVPDFYGSKFRSRNECDFVSRDMLVFFSKAEHVVTNRLHVGVAAALMGVRVTYLDNSYGKIRAVYEATMRDIPGVEFGRASERTIERAIERQNGIYPVAGEA